MKIGSSPTARDVLCAYPSYPLPNTRACHLRWLMMIAVLVTLGRPNSGSAQSPPPAATDGQQSSPAALAAYADAANLQNAGEYDVAVEEWKKFLERYPNDPLATAAQHYVGVCCLQQKKTAEAAQAFAAVLATKQPFDALDEALVNLGWCQYTLGTAGDKDQLNAASKTFTQFRDKFPDSKFLDQALFYGGETLYAQGKHADSIGWYRLLVERFPKSPLRAEGLYALGVALQDQNKHDSAEKVFDLFLSQSNNHKLANEVRLRKAEALVAQQRFDVAEQIFAELGAVQDFDAADRALYRQAFCAAKQDHWEQAAQIYGSLVERFPKSELLSDAMLAAGRAWYRTGQFSQAQPWFTRLIDEKSTNQAEAAHWLTRILLKEKKPADAAKIADTILSSDSTTSFAPQLRLDLADALFDLPERRQESLAMYEQVVQQHGDSPIAPQALYNGAFAALELKQFERALQWAAQFEQSYPTHALRPDAAHVAAESQLLSGKHQAAAEAYQQLINAHPQHPSEPTWRLRHGLALYLDRQYEPTVATLSSVLEKLPAGAAQAEALYLVGMSQGRLGKIDDAIATISRSLQADLKWPDADDAMLALANFQSQQQQHDAARSTLLKAQELFPNSPLLDRITFQLAELEFAANRFPESIAQYDHLLSTFGSSPLVASALYGKGWAELKSGKLKEADATLSQLLDRFASHELAAKTLRSRAFGRQLKGDFRAALSDINRFLETNPQGEDRLDALYIKGLCQSGIKQFQDAATSFQTVVDSGPNYARLDRVLYELAWALDGANQKGPSAERFAELAKKFPDSSFAAEAFYHVAELQYDTEKFADAAQSYANALAKATTEELKEKATYKIGWTAFRQKDYAKAGEAFANQVANFPAGPLATDGMFMVAECQFRNNRFEDALRSYNDLMTRQGLTGNASILTLLHAGQAANQLQQWEQAATILQRLLTEHTDSPYRPQAQYELGWAKQNLSQWQEAEQAYRAVIESSRNAVGARAQFMLGELYFGQKDFAKALAEFQRLTYGYGADRAPDDVKPWQAKGGLEAGRCAAVLAGQSSDEIQKREYLGRARKYFQHVVQQHPGSDEARAAQDQLKKIGNP